MLLATTLSRSLPRSSGPAAAGCLAACEFRSTRWISLQRCCRHSHRKRKVVGLANAGADTTNSIKQAAAFGVGRGGQKLAGVLGFINDVNTPGLEAAQGLLLTNALYWDRHEES